MTSETDHPRQRTVAELLAQYGDGAATGRRRRRRAAEDPEDPEDGAAAEVVDLVGTVAPERRPGPVPEPDRSVPEGSAARDVADQPSGGGVAGGPIRGVAAGEDRADAAPADEQAADAHPADRTGDGRSGGGWTGARNGGGPTGAASGSALFDRGRPADGGPSPATEQLPRVRSGSSTRPDPGLTGPIRRRPTGSGPAEPGDPAEEQTLFGVPTAAGSAPAAAGAGARQWALGAPDRVADGGPATRDADRPDHSGGVDHPGGIDHPDGIDRREVDGVDGYGPDGYGPGGYGPDEHEVDEHEDERGPAGLDGPDEPQRRLGRAAAASPGQAWAVVLAQWIVGALGGAVLWVGFRFLWRSLPVVALAAAVLITVGLVVVVRALLRNDDTRTTMFAVLVGLLLTVSPAILVLLDR